MAIRDGYGLERWDKAVEEATIILKGCARDRNMITYSDLCSRIKTIAFNPHVEIGHLLEDVSRLSFERGEGILSVMVVHKCGDMIPGNGFFDLAKRVGYQFKDKDKFFVEELRRVWAENAGVVV